MKEIILAGRSTAVFGLPRLLNGRFPNHGIGRGPVLYKVATKVSRLTPCRFFFGELTKIASFQTKVEFRIGTAFKTIKRLWNHNFIFYFASII